MSDDPATIIENALAAPRKVNADGVESPPHAQSGQAVTTICPLRQDSPGVACRKCGCCHLPVYYTRRLRGFIMRVRECRQCGRRLVTREAEV